jgi:Uma2 family endonuclease
MIKTGSQLTLEEFIALPDGDIYYEFVDGQAIPKVSPKYFHSTLQLALGSLIRVWSKGKGRVGSEWAVLLKRQGKDWASLPDITYISYERLPKSWRKNEACPALPELGN